MKRWLSYGWTKRRVGLIPRKLEIIVQTYLSIIGYIDLSKRRVSPEDIVKCEERYNKGKMVASIMRHVAEKTKTPMETLYQDIGWPLNKKYGHALDAFRLSIT